MVVPPLAPRLRRTLITLALGAGLSATLTLPRPAVASGERVVIDNPIKAQVLGKVRFTARATRGARRLVFRVDGKWPRIDYHPSWRYGRTGVLDTRSLRPGRHRLSVRARFRNGASASDSTTLSVVRATAPPPKETAPKPLERAPNPPSWTSSFEDGTFSEWTWWKRNDGCSFSVASIAATGIPQHTGTKAAHFETTPGCLDAGRPHSKLFKEWALAHPQTSWRDDAGRSLQRLPNGSPSGSYRASYLLPSNYTHRDRGWTNIMQFKATNPDTGQLPQWWVNVSPARDWNMGGMEPMLNVENWGNGTYGGSIRPAPRGRWFEIRAEVYNRDRIDFYLDGEYWQTVRNETHRIGTAAGTQGWIFGVGHYLGVGKLWIDRASFTPR